MRTFRILIFFCLAWASSAWSMEIYLKNGDKIGGVMVSEDSVSLLLQTLEAGEIKIAKSFIDLPKTYPEKYAPPRIMTPQPLVVIPAVLWKKDMTLGYTQEGGNTKSQLGVFSADVDRKTISDEASMKFDSSYSSSGGKMNGKKFYGMLRYATSFGKNLKWYDYYMVEGDEDYFADIYYRVTPGVGVGYWFSDTNDLKSKAELGLGYEYTAYRIETTPDTGQPIMVPRFFLDKRLIANFHLSEDLAAYPSLEDFRDYRVRSETDLVNQINKRWSCKISYIDDFNSDPPPGFKKHDYTWVTSLEYHY